MNVKEIITWNADVLALAKDMNNRAGKKIFPEIAREEFRLWLKSRINGATSLKEIPNLARLKLPELSKERVGEIKKNNPTSIELFGNSLPVYYSRAVAQVKLDLHSMPIVDWEPCTEFDFVLPGGREYSIVLTRGGQYYESVKTFQELKNKVTDYLEHGRKEVLLSKARDQYTVSQISSRSKIFDLLPKLGKPGVIIDGEIAGYLALSYNRHIDSQIMVLEDEKMAQSLTEQGLENLFEDEVRSSLSVPEVSDFYDQGFYSRILNPLGQKLEQYLNSLFKEYLEGIGISNIQKRIEDFKGQAADAVTMYQENAGLYKAGLKNLDFESLINGKRVEELTVILEKVQQNLQYSEEEIVKALYALTKNGNGLLKKGNKLWLTLKKDFPGDEYEVNTEDLSFAVMEIVEEQF